jgi:hypothetical protein
MVNNMENSNLSTNKIDIVVSVGKGAAGLVPFFGGTIGEIIGNIIPNQRIDRIVHFLESLDGKVSEVEKEQYKSKITSPGFVDMMEDAFQQASRALTDERIEYISELIKQGLKDDQLAIIEKKKILWLLGELNDLEIIILKSYDHTTSQDEEFHNKHQDVIIGPQAYLGSSQEEVDKYSIHQTYRKHLEDLRLLSMNFKKPRRGEFPEFDERTGMMKSSGYSITNLGNLLLRYIGLSQER